MRRVLIGVFVALFGASLSAQYSFSHEEMVLIEGPLATVQAFVAAYEEPQAPPPCNVPPPMAMLHGIPDFSNDLTRITNHAVNSGHYNDPETWDLGRVPNGTDLAIVDACVSVQVTDTSAMAFNLIVRGSIWFKPDVPTRLTLMSTMQIIEGGSLQIGTAVEPITATADIVTGGAPIDFTNDGVGVYDPDQWGTGIHCFGVCLAYGHALGQTQTLLAADPVQGGTTLTVANAAHLVDWLPGMEIVVPDTRHLPFREGFHPSGPLKHVTQDESVTVASIAGPVITLTTPLLYHHTGFKNPTTGVTEMFADIANLSRNITIRSEGVVRGHSVYTGHATVDLRYVRFDKFGRTTGAPLHDTVVDASTGNVVTPGTNPKRLYPIHLHHLIGPHNPMNTGYQYQLIGNAIVDGGKWGITIHNAHYGKVTQNVVYGTQGCGICTEEGNETENEIDGNFVAKVRSLRNSISNGGIDTPASYDIWWDGSGISERGPNNYVRDNRVYSVSFAGYNLNGYYLGEMHIPKFRGADTRVLGEYVAYNVPGQNAPPDRLKEGIPQKEHARNKAVSAYEHSWFSWSAGCCGTANYKQERVFTDYTGFHFTVNGMDAFHESRLTFDRAVLLNNPTITDQNQGGDRHSKGFKTDNPVYEMGGLIIKNSRIEGFDVGIALPPRPNSGSTGHDYAHVFDSTLKNWVNIKESVPGMVREVLVRNVKFEAMAMATPTTGMPAAQTDIWMNPTINPSASTPMLSSRFLVEDFNGVASDDVEVFFLNQAPDFIVPQNSDPAKGVPVAGLTNTQAQQTYGRSFEDRIATCQTPRARIIGFVCPVVP